MRWNRKTIEFARIEETWKSRWGCRYNRSTLLLQDYPHLCIIELGHVL